MGMHHNPLAALPAGWNPDAEVIKGVRWGKPEWIPSAAYWATAAFFATEATHGFFDEDLTLAEEVGFCLLGGFGITAELNSAYFDALRTAGVFQDDCSWSSEAIEILLLRPALVEGRPRRYRFPHQKAVRIAQALKKLRETPPPVDDHLAFRRALMDLPGIGPKTASWITRNWLNSDLVAILDIHVLRAGAIIGLFDDAYSLPKDYERLEARFLEFCDAIGVRASLMDAIIWTEMRQMHLVPV